MTGKAKQPRDKKQDVAAAKVAAVFNEHGSFNALEEAETWRGEDAICEAELEEYMDVWAALEILAEDEEVLKMAEPDDTSPEADISQK